MELLIEVLEKFLHYSVEFGAIGLEIVGVYIMICSAVKCLIAFIKKEEFDVDLGNGISSALEFLMCGEVLKTATANAMEDYIALAAIIALRFALALEVHWEQKNHHAKENHE